MQGDPALQLSREGHREQRDVARTPRPAGPRGRRRRRPDPAAPAFAGRGSAQRCHAGGTRHGHGSPDLSKVECPFKSSMLRNRKYHFGNRSPTSALDYSSQIIRSTEIWDRTRVCDRTKGIRSTLHGPSQISAPSRHCKRIRMRKLTVNLRIVDSFARVGQRSSLQ